MRRLTAAAPVAPVAADGKRWRGTSMRPLTAAALVALALLLASGATAGAQTSSLPDSLWRAYTPPQGHSAALADDDGSGFPFLGVLSVLVGGALLVGLRLSLRGSHRAPAASLPAPRATAPARRTPVALLEPSTRPVIPPALDDPVEVTRLAPPVPEPEKLPAHDEEADPARRHQELYEAVYQRQLDRINRRRSYIRRHVDQRGTDES